MSTTKAVTVWCDRNPNGEHCGHYHEVNEGYVATARKAAKRDGWEVAHAASGWDVCPCCAGKCHPDECAHQ